MSCRPITDSIAQIACGMRSGGLRQKIYVTNWEDIASITSSTNDKLFDSITMKTNPITSQPYFWHQINFKRNSAGMNNEMQFGDNIFANQTLTFQVEGISLQSLTTLQNMVDGAAVFIVVDSRGQAHLLGRLDGLRMSEMTVGTGAASTDFYGGTITFLGEETELSNLIASGTTIQVDDLAGGTTTVTF